MIGGYSDHAANERTFLAWVRTGIAVIAFGFVVEKFNIFMLTLASVALGDEIHRAQLARLSGSMGRYDGLALIFGGVALEVLATVRFVRTTRLLDEMHYRGLLRVARRDSGTRAAQAIVALLESRRQAAPEPA